MSEGAATAVEDLLDQAVRYDGVPGAAVALLEGSSVHLRTMGFADVAARRPVQADTLFQAASLSKTLTALAVLTLAEAGVIALDAPVWRQLRRVKAPRSEFDAEGVTVRRILSHSAGLNVPDYPGFEPQARCPSPEESLTGVGVTTDPLAIVAAPGSGFAYSGAGFTLLQLLIEDASGLAFAAVMNREVLDPLGMKDSFFGDPSDAGRVARPYDGEGRLLPLYRYESQAAAGLYTTAADLGRCLSGARVGNVPATPARWAAMATPRATTGGVDGLWGAYGLGCEIGDFPAGSVVGHHGFNRGWRALMGLEAASGKGLAVLVNGDGGGPLCDGLAEAWFR